jgi:hypothetical protein
MVEKLKYAWSARGLSLALAIPGLGCGGGGSSSPQALEPSGSSGAESGGGGSSGSSSSGAGSSGSIGGTGSSGGTSDASAPGDAGDGSAGADGAPEADAGDGGLQPYKGVANSACADLASLRVSWWYNWTLSSGGCAASQFVPMIWGHAGNEQSLTGIASEVAGIAGGGHRSVLGFNEPDNTGQSNMSVTTAISLWPSFNEPSLRIGSPATQGNGTGLTWIKSFLSQVDADTSGKLRVDFVATHWYGWNAGSCDAKAANLESWIKQIEAIPGNRPIWLTEWGCLNQSNPDAATVQAFFSGAVVMFAKHPRLERYAWYPWTTNNGLVASGALTSLGAVFAAAPSSR